MPSRPSPTLPKTSRNLPPRAFRGLGAAVAACLAMAGNVGAAPPLPGLAPPEDENRDGRILSEDGSAELGRERVRVWRTPDGAWRFAAERVYADGGRALEEQTAVLGRELRPLRYRFRAVGADGRTVEDAEVLYSQVEPKATVRLREGGGWRERVVEYEEGPPYLGLLVAYGVRGALHAGRDSVAYGTLLFSPLVATLDVAVRRDGTHGMAADWSDAPRVRLRMEADLGFVGGAVAALFGPRTALWFEAAPPHRFSRYEGVSCPSPGGPAVRIEPERVLGPISGPEDDWPSFDDL